MQNMWISVALIVAVIIVGIIAGKRLSAPGPQRRAVYFAFGTLAVLALWFFIFVAFFPAEWIVPFFTVACIVIPICVYMMVLRSGGKERAKAPSKRSFEIPKKDITVESAKAASPVSSGTASASSATTPSKAATPAPSASQQTAPASSTPSSTAKTDTSSASATKAKAPTTTAAPAKPAASEAPKATAKPSAEAPKTSAKEAPKPVQAAAKAEAPSTQKSAAESAPVAAPASTKPAESAKSTESQKAKPTKPTKQEAKPASHEAASKPFANKEHVAEIAIEEATEKTLEPPVKAAPATTAPNEDQLREAAEIEILVDRAAEARRTVAPHYERRLNSPRFVDASASLQYRPDEAARIECVAFFHPLTKGTTMDYQTLQDEIKSAMKAHDNNRRDILRQVHTELKAIEVNERRDITEADVDAMLKRVIKQTKETLDGSIKAGNNQERTDTLTEQVAILEGYLPEQVEGEALMALIDEVVAETGATTKKDMGRVMGALTQRTGGNFDKAAAAATLNQRLS